MKQLSSLLWIDCGQLLNSGVSFMNLEISKGQDKPKSDLHSAVYCDLLGYKEISDANKIVDKAGITDRGVSHYILDRFLEGPINLLNTHLCSFVYEYIFSKVEKLLDYELEFDFSEAERRATFRHPRLQAGQYGYYFTTMFFKEQEYQTALIRQCEKIEDKPQFLKWFIEEVRDFIPEDRMPEEQRYKKRGKPDLLLSHPDNDDDDNDDTVANRI